MVNPGILPLSIIRGITFDERVLRLADESVTVTGTLSPDVLGVYIPCGTFAGYPLFILPGSPSSFLYFNTGSYSSYVIAQVLTNDDLTDYWSPAAPLTEPTGTYVPHGANTGIATATDHPVDLFGCTAQAQVRRTSKGEIYIDLNPSITSPSGGEITIPSIPTADTELLEFIGNFNWDLVIKDGSEERTGVYIKGPFSVSDNITQIIPP